MPYFLSTFSTIHRRVTLKVEKNNTLYVSTTSFLSHILEQSGNKVNLLGTLRSHHEGKTQRGSRKSTQILQ